MNFSNEFRHDFSNNIVKLDIIGKLIAEELSSNNPPDKQLLDDLETVIKELSLMQKEIKKTIA